MDAIFDQDRKVRAWLNGGRGVRRWRSQEIGTNRPDMFTPGDVTTPPHWAYRGGDELLNPIDIVFFAKNGIYYGLDPRKPGKFFYAEWSDTRAGWKAAEKVVGDLPKDNGDYPLKFHYRYSIERVTYTTDEKSADGRPVGIHYRVAIIQWSAPRDEETAQHEEMAQHAMAATEEEKRWWDSREARRVVDDLPEVR